MYHLATVTLENEMDLVLAHRRSMKLAEIAGLSLSAQTTFATAVSEISRNTIENGKNGCLKLGISEDKKRSIIACIKDDNLNNKENQQGLQYAMKLVDKLNVQTAEDETSIELFYYVPNNPVIDIHKLDEWRSIFRNEPPLSPYDEIKRKNEQLQEMAAKLKESEDHYRILTDTLPLMMFSIKVNGDIEYVNKWMSDYLGYTCDQLNNIDRSILVHPEDRPKEELLKNLIQQEKPIRAEWRIKDKYGSFTWHMVSIQPLYNDDKIVNWYGFLADIHAQKMFQKTLEDNKELKQVQQQLKQNITELNRSNEELQQFAYIASHDLQEPLRKIIFYSDYIQNKYAAGFDDRSRGYMQSMVNASQRMRILVADLLSFSQVEKKAIKIQFIDLNLLLNKVLANYDMTIQAKGAVIQIERLPCIEGDEVMLQSLFENLLSNALKYSQVRLTPLINITVQENTDEVIIIFSDNGIGFDESFNTRIFALFQRLHTRERFEGTGIGLSICRKIVEMHKGTIKAKGEPDRGATFTIKLPRKQRHD